MQTVMDKPPSLQDLVPVRAQKPESDENGEGLFEVDKILSHQGRGRE